MIATVWFVMFASIAVMAYGVFTKNNLISAIGGSVCAFAMFILIASIGAQY